MSRRGSRRWRKKTVVRFLRQCERNTKRRHGRHDRWFVDVRTNEVIARMGALLGRYATNVEDDDA